MREAVDGIRSSTQDRRPNPLASRIRLSARLVLLAGILFVVGLCGTAIAVGGDVSTLTAMRSMLPPGHYLVLLQNNAELRPSGGFIGSFATVDIGNMGIRQYLIDTNIYKRDNAFTEQHTIQPPPALSQMAPGLRWAMRDANWDIDFRDAAQRVAWFYEQEGGEHVDGVVAVNASVAQDVLRLTGPISVDHLDDTLSADSFFPLLAKEVEQDYFKDPTQQVANEPKSILKGVLRALVVESSRPAVAVKLPSLLQQELIEKQIQLFHTEPVVEARILRNNWGGAIDQSSGDYLLLNNASVGGMKSSLFVGQETAIDITQLPDGSMKHVLSITRTHTGTGVWPDYRNNNYIRVAVPIGSSLEGAVLNGQPVQDVDTTVEAQKTVFGTRFDTDPGHTSILQLTYLTPPSHESGPFTLHFQKQSGTLVEQLRVTLNGNTLIENNAVETDLQISQ